MLLISFLRSWFTFSPAQWEVAGRLIVVMLGSVFSPALPFIKTALGFYINSDALFNLETFFGEYINLIFVAQKLGPSFGLYLISVAVICLLISIAYFYVCSQVGLKVTRYMLSKFSTPKADIQPAS
ncbi:MAG: hypothetical protein KTR14_00055 [Vampirovibrio sp.]|nr:hypothetical protein [Vampirovibrio sp.]